MSVLLSPVNLVDSYSDRWSHAFAFGSMSTSIVLLITKFEEVTNVDEMLKGLCEIISVFIICSKLA